MKKYTIPKRFDTVTAEEIQSKILSIVEADDAQDLTLDFAESEYVSSAGLRVVILIAKKMKAENRELILRNMPEAIYNIFKMAGFHLILNIQND